ncbi:MAG: hypothetical protein ACREAC_14885, partial [Blastocatellia bacterium]
NSADFSETNNCGTSVPAGASCAISVKFVPVAAGSRSATLVVTDNAVDSPQGVNLSGTGIDFSVAPETGSLTVSAGQTANYALQLSALGGRGGDQLNLTVTCSGAPARASCVAPIVPLTVTPTTSATASISVVTMANANIPSPAGFDPNSNAGTRELMLGLPLLLGALLWLMPGKPTAGRGMHRIGAWPAMAMVLLEIVLIGMTGCGTNGGKTVSQDNGTPAGTYTLTITATSASLTHSTSLTLIVK